MSILIAGGGIVGLTLALALRRGLGAPVTVCDPALARTTADLRASAIAAGGRRMLMTLGVWPEAAAQPVHKMLITDSELGDPLRPTFLTFGGEAEPGEPFAHMVENGPLIGTLRQACVSAGVVSLGRSVTRFETTQHGVTARLDDGTTRAAALIVGADGARSPMRELAGIQWIDWGYAQTGLVATLAHERDHEGCAYEHFLPSGPFAMLPLTGRRSSIVWSERDDTAAGMATRPDAEIVEEVELRFGPILGKLSLETPVSAYSLFFGVARRFVGERLALVGEAAHVIHPLAGQGLNLGLRDVAALADAIADAMRLGLDPGDRPVLERYQRARRFDTLTMGAATDGLNRLFSTEALPTRLARDLGMGVVDRLPKLKRFFVREAAGLVGEVPRLMRGEAL
jgi:2-octaprenyl-6-methoxyphenol hydroxylase